MAGVFGFERQLAVFVVSCCGALVVFDVLEFQHFALGRVPNHAPVGGDKRVKVFQVFVVGDDNGVDLFGFAVLVEVLNNGFAVGGAPDEHAVETARTGLRRFVALGIVVGERAGFGLGDQLGAVGFGLAGDFCCGGGDGQRGCLGGGLRAERGGEQSGDKQFFHGDSFGVREREAA